MFELEQIFKRANTVQRYLAAPLARSRLAYLGHRAEQGFQPSTLRGIAAIQVRAVRYLELEEESKITPSEIAAAAERWVTLCRRSASTHVVTSMSRSDCFRLERQLPGGLRTR